MSDDYKAKLRSLHFARNEARKAKETVDHHDYGTVTVTEHYDDRVDVNVAPEPARVSASVNKEQQRGDNG
jgi:hypothetical protein